MPRGIPNKFLDANKKRPTMPRKAKTKTPRAIQRRGTTKHATFIRAAEDHLGLMVPVLMELGKDIRAQLDTIGQGWVQTGDTVTGAHASIQQGPNLALLQERISLSLEQARKQFDRLSQIGDRICGPGTNPIGGDDTKTIPVPGGQIATLNAQLNAMDQIMARVDDQISRLETL